MRLSNSIKDPSRFGYGERIRRGAAHGGAAFTIARKCPDDSRADHATAHHAGLVWARPCHDRFDGVRKVSSIPAGWRASMFIIPAGFWSTSTSWSSATRWGRTTWRVRSATRPRPTVLNRLALATVRRRCGDDRRNPKCDIRAVRRRLAEPTPADEGCRTRRHRGLLPRPREGDDLCPTRPVKGPSSDQPLLPLWRTRSAKITSGEPDDGRVCELREADRCLTV